MFSIEPFCWHYPGCCYCTIVVVIVFIKLLLLLLWRSTQLNNIYNNNNKWMTNNWQAHPSTHQWGEPYKTTIITTKMKNNKRCKIVGTTITKRINKWQGLKTTKQAKNTYVHTTKIYHYLYVYVCLGQHIAECRHIAVHMHRKLFMRTYGMAQPIAMCPRLRHIRIGDFSEKFFSKYFCRIFFLRFLNMLQ